MRRALLLSAVCTLAFSACAGSTSFVGACPDGGYDRECGDVATLVLTPGSNGQRGLTLLVEGSHAGTFDFSATPNDAAALTATVSPASAELKSGVVQDVIVTITAASTAAPTENGSVYVRAVPKGGGEKDGAGRSVRVRIVAP
jgi:hypothetical protein